VVEFKIDGKDKQSIAASFFKRAANILKQESIEFDSKVVAEVVTKHFPDYRRILNELQRYSVTGKIDSGILVNLSQESFRELVGFLKEKKFPEVRKWVAKNSDIETTQLFKELYDNSVDFLDPSTIHHLVLILADYQYKAAFVADHELNTVAAMTEIMIQCKFK
jgi:replication factor C small subunit